MTVIRAFAACCLAVVVAGCGGGSGGNANPPPPPPPTSAPSNLSYGTVGVILDVGIAMTPLTPTVTGTVSSYAVAPDLPQGLSINASTGVISGLPTIETARATYAITARNSLGAATADLIITVHPSPPGSITYPPIELQEGKAMTPVLPTLTGGAPTAFSLSPQLPDGMWFRVNTGEITGTPVVASARQQYSVTALNAGGSTATLLSIIVHPRDPPNYSYVLSHNDVNDVVWSPHHQVLYLACGSLARTHPNSVIAFNPVTGDIANFAFAGSEPSSLALSDDGSVLYVGLRGADEIKRFKLPELSLDLDFQVASEESIERPFFAKRLDVAPGRTQTILAELLDLQITGLQGFQVLDNGIARSGTHGLEHDAVTWGTGDSRLYAALDLGADVNIDTFTTDASSVTQERSRTYFMAPFLDGVPYYDGLIYSNFEIVINPRSWAIVGGMPAAYGHVTVDAASHRAFYARVGEQVRMSVKSFDTQTMTGIEAATGITVESGSPVNHIVRWGRDGLAITTRSGILYTLSGEFVSPGASASPMSGIPVLSQGWQAVEPAANMLSIITNDIAWDEQSGLIYASVPSGDASHPNSIAAIDPATGAAVSYTATLPSPGPLAISDDGQFLYVGSSAGFERFVLPGLSRDFTVPDAGAVNEIAVAPGQARTVAIGGPQGTAIYDDNIPRANRTGGTTRMAWGADSTELFFVDSEDSAFRLYTHQVDASGFSQFNWVERRFTTLDALAFHYDFVQSGGLLYGGTGVVYNPATGRLAGTFLLSFDTTLPLSIYERVPLLAQFAVHQASHRAYAAIYGQADQTGTSPIILAAYDTTTYAPIFRTNSSGVTGTPTRILRLNATTLAVRNARGEVAIASSPVFAN